MNAKRHWVAAAVVAVASIGGFESPVYGYATGDGAGNKLAHQWITLQGWELFKAQFGASEIDGLLGQPTTYPTEARNRVMEGIFSEDEAERNPWGQGATPVLGFTNHPSLRHFWTPNANFARTYDRGLVVTTPLIIIPPATIIPPRTIVFDSAANRGIKYFTGGRDVTGAADDGWDDRGDAALNQGIPQFYAAPADRSKAYYYLGHVAHLLQDLTLPAHSHGDQHLEVGGAGVNPDPLHDWVDGVSFDDDILGNNPTRIAAFDDVNATRYTRWAYSATTKGVGRDGNAGSFLTGDLRSPTQMMDAAFNPSLNAAEIAASIPGNLLNNIRPLYYQMLEAAGISDNYDARNAVGQVDNSGRGDHSVLDLNNYDNWTMEELDGVADIVVPHAMKATAELFRYFYSRVDPTPPELEILGFSPTVDLATEVRVHPNEPAIVKFIGVDSVSGIDLDGFDLTLAKLDETTMAWGDSFFRENRSLPGGGPIGMESFNLTPGRYRVLVANDNGGGLRGSSAYSYFQVVLVPEPTAALLAGVCSILPASRRRSRRLRNS